MYLLLQCTNGLNPRARKMVGFQNRWPSYSLINLISSTVRHTDSGRKFVRGKLDGDEGICGRSGNHLFEVLTSF